MNTAFPVLENDCLRVVIDPNHGGRVIHFFDKRRQAEQLWYDSTRLPVNPALDYDGNFAGGMDELLPNDPPEDGFPDHGELWTLPLAWEMSDYNLWMQNRLQISQLSYRREMHLEDNALVSTYRIENTSDRPLDFLWKLHAALRIEEGDMLEAPARCVQAADPGDWSAAAHGMPRQWPGKYAIPCMDGTSDFFYLTDLTAGKLWLHRKDGGVFRCDFNTDVFHCAWIFASYGRLNDSQTLIMEPCTNYPGTLAEARRSKVCAHLEPGETLKTTVKWIGD